MADHVDGGAGVAPAGSARSLRSRRVLVTGGGFIGGRLAEVLVGECGAEVVVLVRRPESADRFVDLSCEVMVGDVTDGARVADAVAGCDTVFHCAYGTSGSSRHRAFVNRSGTRRVLLAAGAAGVRRVVCLSTFMVYGRTGPGDLTEVAARRRFGTGYADSKLAAERIALDLARAGRTPAVVLQPTNVLGPNSDVWAKDVITKLRSGLIPLLDGGSGLCNYVYVDDLVQAMLRAATVDGVVGEAFLVSAAEPVTWREFYAGFERLLGQERTVAISVAEAEERWRRAAAAVPHLHTELSAMVRERGIDPRRLLNTREGRALRTVATAVLPENLQQRVRKRWGPPAGAAPPAPSGAPGPVHLLTPAEIAFFSARTRVRIDKGRRVLGYEPVVDLDSGMRSTASWLQESGLLPR